METRLFKNNAADGDAVPFLASPHSWPRTGWGGLEAVSQITGLARSTIGRGLKDLNAAPLPKGRVRRKGGGRRHLSSRDTTLIKDLRNVIEPATLGDPMRPLLWVSKSYDKLAYALQKKGHEISASSVKRLLPTLGYSRQSNRRADEGSKHPDRNAQFEHINAKAIAYRGAASLRRPNWSRPLPKLLIVSGVMTAATLNDVRVMIERHLPAASRANEMWRYVSNELREAALGSDTAEFSAVLEMALSIEGLEWALK